MPAPMPHYDLLRGKVLTPIIPLTKGFESSQPAPLAISSANTSLTNSTTHAMRAASMAHKPSIAKTPEQAKTSPHRALRAAAVADRDSTVRKSPTPTHDRTAEESTKIQPLAHELAKRDTTGRMETTPGGVSRPDLPKVAALTMARKQASDQAEHERVEAFRRKVLEEVQIELQHQQELDDAARRIVAERLAQLTLSGDECDEALAGKAAGESILRGNERARDWENVLQSQGKEDRLDKERNAGRLRQSIRPAPSEASKSDPALILAAAQRNVKSQLDGMDKSIAQEQMLLRKSPGRYLARRDAQTKGLEEKGQADLERRQKERASTSYAVMRSDGLDTYDIGGLVMTREQVEAIAQKHVNEVLAEINEKVERERERIDRERIEREAKIREKQQGKELARERAAEEKVERERIKAEQREQKAEQKRLKDEAKAAEKKRKEEKHAQRESKAAQKDQLTTGLVESDAQKDSEAEFAHRNEESGTARALAEAQDDPMAVVAGVLQRDSQKDQEESAKKGEEKTHTSSELAEREGGNHRNQLEDVAKPGKEQASAIAEQARVADAPVYPNHILEDDSKGHKLKSWLKEKREKFGRRLSRHTPGGEPILSPTKEDKGKAKEPFDDDLYGQQLPSSSHKHETDMRDDSLKNVALAKPEDEPGQTASAEDSDVEEIQDVANYMNVSIVPPTFTDESGDEEFKDADSKLEGPANSSPTVKGEEGKMVSSERVSRFKEEF